MISPIHGSRATPLRVVSFISVPRERVEVYVYLPSSVCRQVNEADNAMTPVEIPKAGGTDEVPEDNVSIKYEVNGDVERTTSEGTDLDPADQTLVEEVSVIQEFPVSGVSALRP